MRCGANFGRGQRSRPESFVARHMSLVVIVTPMSLPYSFASFPSASVSQRVSRTTEARYTATTGAAAAGAAAVAVAIAVAVAAVVGAVVDDGTTPVSFVPRVSPPPPPLVLLKNFANVFFSHFLCCSGVASMNSLACSFSPPNSDDDEPSCLLLSRLDDGHEPSSASITRPRSACWMFELHALASCSP